MAASGVTYEGVPSAQGGNIFNGTKFWVSLKVPQRSTFLDHIRSNGGVVVSLEKDADMLIADCARKNVPKNSYSWKFIDDSIKSGCAQLKDRYRISVDRSESSSAHQTRSTRTCFTIADDIALARFLLQSGENFSGRKIYKDLEQRNPRHTWQSWRNRYMNSMLKKTPAELQKLANLEIPADDLGQSESTPRNSQRPSGNVETPRVTKHQGRAPASPTPQARPSTPRRDRGNPQSASLVREENEESTRPRNQACGSSGGHGESRSFEEAQQFYHDLSLYCEECGVDPIETKHVIGHKTVELFDLMTEAVKHGLLTSDFSLDGLDWSSVATRLGYNVAEEPQVPRELWKCFENNLAEFCDVMGEAQGIGSKRSLENTASSENSTKRKRGLSHDVEIPATPDHKIELPDRLESPQMPSPSLRSSIFERAASIEADPGPTMSSQPQSQRRILPSMRANARQPEASPASVHSASARGITHQGQATEPGRRQKTDIVTSAVVQQATKKAGRRSLPSSFSAPKSRDQSRPDVNTRDPQARGFDGSRIKQKVEHYKSLGFPQDIVVKALQHTSLRPGELAAFVMQRLKDGKDVPSNYEGIWTDEDDHNLRMADQVLMSGVEESRETKSAKKELERLTHKHGSQGIELRRRILEALADGD